MDVGFEKTEMKEMLHDVPTFRADGLAATLVLAWEAGRRSRRARRCTVIRSHGRQQRGDSRRPRPAFWRVV